MNIEQIADAVSQEMLMHVATVQPELVKWNMEFLRSCLSKLAEQDFEHVGEVTHRAFGYVKWASERPEIGTKLYTEAQLLAAQQRTADACANVCEATADEYQETESRLWPECRSDAQSGASSCEGSIRNGELMEYL